MLGKKRGGLEQAVLDYAEALAVAKIPALTLISPNAWVEAPLVAAGVPHESLANFAAWDPFAAKRLRRITEKHGATAIICHGNRALTLALKSLKGRVPIIAVAHNYSNKRFAQADRCIAITQHLATHLAQLGAKNVAQIPNMVRIHEATSRPAFRNPPAIGSMGRFVAKKGFEIYIEALALLKARQIPFRAVLGGDGELRSTYEALVVQHNLQHELTFTGWVKDKNEFFDAIDLFVLPSHHEPFGIVLIEAMAQSLPIVSTDSEGPSEILQHGKTGMLTIKTPQAVADALEQLLKNPAAARTMGHAGYEHAARDYSLDAMSARLKSTLNPYAKENHHA